MRESITQVLSTMEERKDQQETGLCKHSQLCVGHTSGKLPDNIVTGVTVLVTQSVTYTLPLNSTTELQKVWNCIHP